MARTKRYIVVGVFLAGGAMLGAAVSGPCLDLASAGIQQALDSLQAGDFEQAEKQALAVAAGCDEPNPRAWVIVAAARQRRGDRASAGRAYRFFLAASDSPDTQQFALEQIQACEQGPREPQSLAPPSGRLDKPALDRLAEVHEQTSTEYSEHFVVKARNPHLAKLLAAEAEVALDRICQVILAGQEYPHSVVINVWADHDDYRAHATDAPEWAGGSFRLTSSEGVITRQIDLTQRDENGHFAVIMLDRVLPHEMCHLVLTEYFGDATCPLFLNEGLAMMAESEPDLRRIRIAGQAIPGKARLSLQDLFVCRRYDVEEPSVFYARAFSFVEFLHGRLTPRQFRAFLEHVKGGATIADALQRSLYMPASEAFLPALASAWEDHAIEQSQYLQALAAAEQPDPQPSGSE